MSKKCQCCGYENSEEHFFCQRCGQALDANVRVLMQYEKMKKEPSRTEQAPSRRDEDDDYVPVRREQKKKSKAALWAVLVCLAAVCGVAAWLMLSH